MADEEIENQEIERGAGVYKIAGEGQQFGSLFNFADLFYSDSDAAGLDFTALDQAMNYGGSDDNNAEAASFMDELFRQQEIEDALAIAGAADFGGPFGVPLVPSPTTITGVTGSNDQAIIDYILGTGSVPISTGTNSGYSITTPEDETEATLLEKAQEQVRRIGSAVGKAQDTLFDIFGIRKPDYSVIQPNAPGGTVIWGQPSGGVFGRIGTTPGGTVTGVQTGIPALDIVLGKVADIVSGRVAAGDVLTPETIKDIIIQTAGDELGIPGDPNQVLADIKEIGSQVFYDENTGKLGIDLGDGAAPDVVPDAVDVVTNGATISDIPTLSTTGGNDRATLNDLPTLSTTGGNDKATLNDLPTLSTTGGNDKATLNDLPTLSTTGGDRATISDIPTLSTTGGDRATVLDIPTLSTTGGDRTLTIPDFDPTETERAPTLTTDRATTSDRAPGGGGVGLGETGVTPTGGMRGVSTEQAGVADIANMYDPSLSLAENMARMLGKNKKEQADAVDSALMYGGGIVQPTDLNTEILRIIEGR